MGRGFLNKNSDWKDWTLPDNTACKIPYYINIEKRGNDWYIFSDDGTELGIQKKGCLYFEQTHFPLMERGIKDDDFSDLGEKVDKTIWTGVPHPGAHLLLDDKGLAEMSVSAKELRKKTDRAIIGLFGANMFEIPQWLYRMDNYLMYMGLYPEKVHELSEKLCDIHLKNLEKWLQAVGPYVDIILFGDDFGGQQGTLLSTEMYREYYKPFHKKLCTRAKELANVKILLHSCGAIEPLLNDFIDAGFDAVNPVQITCRNMEPKYLKRKYGERLCFWGGGCDTREILPYAEPDTVKNYVYNQVNTLNSNGGFVFQQVHNIMADVPPENILAMFNAVRQ